MHMFNCDITMAVCVSKEYHERTHKVEINPFTIILKIPLKPITLKGNNMNRTFIRGLSSNLHSWTICFRTCFIYIYLYTKSSIRCDELTKNWYTFISSEKKSWNLHVRIVVLWKKTNVRDWTGYHWKPTYIYSSMFVNIHSFSLFRSVLF